jgi:translation initiation factor 6
MHLLKTNFNGNPNIGLYGYCNNKYCLLGTEVPEAKAHLVGEVLKVPVHRITICGTSLLGVFLAGNSNTLLVPEIAFDYELKKLEHLGIKYSVVKTRQTALGNNMICNDRGCVCSRDFLPETKTEIKEALGVETKQGTIAGFDIVGSLAAFNSTACVVHRDITKQEEKHIKDVMGLNCVPSTVNMGSPYIRSGLLCNDHGFLIGDTSGGPEIVNVEDELGFLNQETARKERKAARKIIK